MNKYIIQLLPYSYIEGIGGVYILLKEGSGDIIDQHFSTNDSYAKMDLLPKIPEKDYEYKLYGVEYYGH